MMIERFHDGVNQIRMPAIRIRMIRGVGTAEPAVCSLLMSKYQSARILERIEGAIPQQGLAQIRTSDLLRC
jgi:hypothetical protein